MPRPRTTSTSRILAAASAVISRLGLGGLTLAEVAGEVGLSPAALVQRFGSKRGLLLAVARHRAENAGESFATARTGHPSRIDALVEALAGSVGFIRSPEELSNHLAFLQADLRDPEFHALALQHAHSVRTEIRALLQEATDIGETVRIDPENLARTVQTAYNGALITWAIYREGTLEEWIRGEVEEVLAPWIVQNPPAA